MDLLDKGNKLIDKNFTIIPNSTLESLSREITLLWIALGVISALFLITFFSKWDEGLIAWVKGWFQKRS
jgi:hypothetical protein